jgi:hypothetical protein
MLVRVSRKYAHVLTLAGDTISSFNTLCVVLFLLSIFLRVCQDQKNKELHEKEGICVF